MTSRLRTAFALLLALTLAIASVGFVQARHMAAGAQTMVICTGYGLVQITIDADGNPVERTLPCPDCVVMPLALGPDAGPLVRPVLTLGQATWTLRDTLRKAAAAGHWHSPRAPPFSFV
jgi:hypothetical protein